MRLPKVNREWEIERKREIVTEAYAARERQRDISREDRRESVCARARGEAERE